MILVLPCPGAAGWEGDGAADVRGNGMGIAGNSRARREPERASAGRWARGWERNSGREAGIGERGALAEL